MSENLSCKHSQKCFDHAKESTTDEIKTTSKRLIQNTTEVLRLQNFILNLNGKINKSIFAKTIRPKYFQYSQMVIIMLSNGDKICEKGCLSYLGIGIFGKTYCLIQLPKTERLKERKQTRSIMG